MVIGHFVCGGNLSGFGASNFVIWLSLNHTISHGLELGTISRKIFVQASCWSSVFNLFKGTCRKQSRRLKINKSDKSDKSAVSMVLHHEATDWCNHHCLRESKAGIRWQMLLTNRTQRLNSWFPEFKYCFFHRESSRTSRNNHAPITSNYIHCNSNFFGISVLNKWGWVKTYYYHIWKNQHPLTSYFRYHPGARVLTHNQITLFLFSHLIRGSFTFYPQKQGS